MQVLPSEDTLDFVSCSPFLFVFSHRVQWMGKDILLGKAEEGRNLFSRTMLFIKKVSAERVFKD